MNAITKPREQWMTLLARLTAPGNTAAVADALREMIPLVSDLPDAAFNLTSLEYVARSTRRAPTYAELREHLGTWWRDHRPEPQRALPGPTAEQQRYTELQAELAADWDDREGIRAKVNARLRDSDHPFNAQLWRILAAAVARHAPQHIALIPPQHWPEWFSAP